MDDFSVGVKSGKEGQDGGGRAGAGAPDILRSGWAVRLGGSLDALMVVPVPIDGAGGAGSQGSHEECDRTP